MQIRIRLTAVAAVATLTATTLAMGFAAHAAEPSHRSPYAGQETRAIKSLSADDIAELENGRGWGLARPAELNGMPGPAHVLELAGPLGLSAEQRRAVQALFDEMNAEARRLGNRLIHLEASLDQGFARRTMDESELRRRLDEIAGVTGALRFVHLRAHLRGLALLTARQVKEYSHLRGYGGEATSGGATAPAPEAQHRRMH
jgi:hypothetical protein